MVGYLPADSQSHEGQPHQKCARVLKDGSRRQGERVLQEGTGSPFMVSPRVGGRFAPGEGRHNRCLAPSGLWMFLTIDPRALPWAGMFRPFGAWRAISTMQVIEELIKLAKDLDAATNAGKEMGLTDDEKAFYDALAANDSAVTAMGDAKLKVIAAELITQVKRSVTSDWNLREGAQAKIRVMVRRILNKHGYWLPRCRRSVGLRPMLRIACLSRPAPSARRTCRKKP
jgi:hypothetical protein